MPKFVDLPKDRDPTRVRNKFGYLHNTKDEFYGIPDSTNDILDQGEITGVNTINGVPRAEVHGEDSDAEDFTLVGGSHDALAAELNRYTELLPEDVIRTNAAIANANGTPLVRAPPPGASSAIRKGIIQPESVAHPDLPEPVADRHGQGWFKVEPRDDKVFKSKFYGTKVVPTSPPEDIEDEDQQQDQQNQGQGKEKRASRQGGRQGSRTQQRGRDEGEDSDTSTSSSTSTSTSEDEEDEGDDILIHRPGKQQQQQQGRQQQQQGRQQQQQQGRQQQQQQRGQVSHPFQAPHASFDQGQGQAQGQRGQQQQRDGQRGQQQRGQQQQQQQQPQQQQRRQGDRGMGGGMGMHPMMHPAMQQHPFMQDMGGMGMGHQKGFRRRAPGLYGGPWWHDAAGLNFHEERALLDEFHAMEQSLMRQAGGRQQRQQQGRSQQQHGMQQPQRGMQQQQRGAQQQQQRGVQRGGQQQQQQPQRQQAQQQQQPQQQQQQQRGGLFSEANVPTEHKRAALSAYSRLRDQHGPTGALQQMAKQYEKGYRKGGGVEGAISAVTEGEVIRAPRPESTEDDEWDDDLSVAEEKRISQAFLALEHAMAGYRARKTGAKPSSQGLFEGREVHPQRQRQALDTFARLSQEKGEDKAMKKMSKLYDKGYQKGGIEGAISAVTEGKVEKAPRPESAEDDEWEDDLSVAEEKRIAQAFLALEHAMEPHVHAHVEKRRSKGKAAADISHLTQGQQGQQRQQHMRGQQQGLQGQQQQQHPRQQQHRQQPQHLESSQHGDDVAHGDEHEGWEDMPVNRRQRGQHAQQLQQQRGAFNPFDDDDVHRQVGGFAPFMDPRFMDRRHRWFDDRDSYPYGHFW